MEPSRSINHETEATSSSAINYNNASIIQNPSIRYDIRKPQSSSATSVPLHSSSSLRVDNNGYGGSGGRIGAGAGGGGSSRASMKRKNADQSSFHSLHYDNAQDIIMANRKMHTMNLNRATSRQMPPRRGMHDGSDSYSSKSASSYGSSCSASSCDGSDTSSTSGEPNLGTDFCYIIDVSTQHLTVQRVSTILLFLSSQSVSWFSRIIVELSNTRDAT